MAVRPTEILNKYLKIDLTKVKALPYGSSPVRYRHVTLVGLPESGKSTTAKILIAALKEHYKDQGYGVNAVLGNTIKDCKEKMNPAPVQIFLVDDALRGGIAGARTTDMLLNIIEHYMMRNDVWAYSQEIKYVLMIFCTQRWGNLDIVFRNALLTGFKSIYSDPADNKSIGKFLNWGNFHVLSAITSMIYEDQSDFAKKFMVIKSIAGQSTLVYLPDTPSYDPMDVINIKSTYGKDRDKKSEENRKLSIAVIALARKQSPTSYVGELLDSLRDKMGLKFDDTLAHEVINFMDSHPEAKLVDVGTAFDLNLPARYYYGKRILKPQTPPPIDEELPLLEAKQ